MTRGRASSLRCSARCGARVKIEPPFRCDYGTNIVIGDDVYMNFNCVVLDCAAVRIGDRVLIAPGVQILAATHPLDVAERRTGRELARPVTIGDDVWLGAGVIVSPGVTIGAGRSSAREASSWPTCPPTSSPSATRAACCGRSPRSAECRHARLYATSECAPWVKTGGLGDVAGALTRALRADGHRRPRAACPRTVRSRSNVDSATRIAAICRRPLRFPGERSLEATIAHRRARDAHRLPGACSTATADRTRMARAQDFDDNAKRFALLSRTAALLATATSPIDWRPDVLHCNDWQTGPAPALVRYAPPRAHER